MLPPKRFTQMRLCNPYCVISFPITSKHGETEEEIYYQRFHVFYLHVSGQ